jgi:hypothetical protein
MTPHWLYALRHPCCGWIGQTHIQLAHGIELSRYMRLQGLSSEQRSKFAALLVNGRKHMLLLIVCHIALPDKLLPTRTLYLVQTVQRMG